MLFSTEARARVVARWEDLSRARSAAGNTWLTAWDATAIDVEAAFKRALDQDDAASWREVCTRTLELRRVLGREGEDTRYFICSSHLSDEIDATLSFVSNNPANLVTPDSIDKFRSAVTKLNSQMHSEQAGDRALAELDRVAENRLEAAKDQIDLIPKLPVTQVNHNYHVHIDVNLGIESIIGATRDVIDILSRPSVSKKTKDLVHVLWTSAGHLITSTKKQFHYFRLTWRKIRHEDYFVSPIPDRMTVPDQIPVILSNINIRSVKYFSPGGGLKEWFQDFAEAPEMVVIPAGYFMMGAATTEPNSGDDERPIHQVTFARPFAISRFAVRFSDWDFYADQAHDQYRPDDKGWGRGDRPVINVSREDAMAYTAWLSSKTGVNYRLPSEAEWEYAARAGTSTAFWWGDTIRPEQANYDGNYTYADGEKGVSHDQTVKVDSFEANQWGLFQVHGNVWEWVADHWNDSYDGAPSDGSVWKTGSTVNSQVQRGGSWIYAPKYLRSAFRLRVRPRIRNDDVGFRVVREL